VICSISSASISPARCRPHSRRQSGNLDDRRHAGAGRAHQQRRHGLVAAADQHHRVHRLRAHHLLDVDAHQVAHEHGGRIGEGLVDRDGREVDRQPAGQHHAALDGLDEVGHVAVARIEAAVGVGDADDRAIQRIVGIAHGLDE
jgi:hypothetical protein